MPPRSRFSFAERLTLVTMALAVLHHLDHVLRVDHAGWPSRSEVTPLTYSLLLYVILAALLRARGWPRTRIALSAVLALTPTAAHIVFESPARQYVTWAARPEINWLGVSSPVLGGLAVLLPVLLSVAAAGVLVAFIRSRGV